MARIFRLHQRLPGRLDVASDDEENDMQLSHKEYLLELTEVV